MVVFGAVCAYENEDVVVGDFFLAVGKAEESLVNLIELFSVELYPVNGKTMFKRGTPAARCQYYLVVVDAYIFGIDYFVSLNILEHAILVYARRVRKGIAPHDCLVWLHWHVHKARHHATCGIYLLGVYIRLYTYAVMTLAYHGYFFKCGISGALAYAVDCYLYLTCAVEHPRHGICGSHA